MKDARPDYSADQLYELIFQDPVSIKWQFYKCSAGDLRIEPTNLGVVDVTIDAKVNSVSKNQAVNMATTEVIKAIRAEHSAYANARRLRDYADLTLFVTPDMGKWLAYASLGGSTSVYNNKWGAYLSVPMHEIG